MTGPVKAEPQKAAAQRVSERLSTPEQVSDGSSSTLLRDIEVLARPMPSNGAAVQTRAILNLQRTVGNRATGALLRQRAARSIQPKLTVGEADDEYERGADAAADRVVAGRPVERLSRLPALGLSQRAQRQTDEEPTQTQEQNKAEENVQAELIQGQEVQEDEPVQPFTNGTPAQRKCPECEEEAQRRVDEDEEAVQTKARSGQTGLDTAAAEREMARSGSGQPLGGEMLARMEGSFGTDFSGVRVHIGTAAQEANRAINARAFTRGADIYLGQGESPSNSRLMAHELTHVVQQNHNLSRTPAILMRQQGGGGQARAAPTTFHQRLYVVRDPSIGLGGGHLVTDLAAFKAHVMRSQNTGTWTLVLAIHGSLDRIAAQAPPNWQQNAVFYTAADINALFNGDRAWVRWRDTYGPSHLALVSCQVSASFEGAMIDNLTRHVARAGSSTAAPTQSARGLGTHCKPLSASRSYEYPSGTAITSRRQYQRLSASAKSDMQSALSALNSKYGYYGASPVPNSQIVDYYLDADPHGEWAIVTVGFDQGGNVSDTDIPFWNRTTGPRSAEFRRLCDQGVGTLNRPHIPRAP